MFTGHVWIATSEFLPTFPHFQQLFVPGGKVNRQLAQVSNYLQVLEKENM